MEDSMNVGLLPEVIILEIFRHLSYADLCKAAQVSKSWRCLSQDGSLRKVIDVRDYPMTPESIEEFVVHQCSDHLIDLKLRLVGEAHTDCDPDSEIEYDYELPYTNITPHCLKLLEDYAPNLKCFTLEMTQQIVNGEDRIAFIASLPKSITHLSLADGSFLDRCGIKPDSISDCSNVVCLDTRKCFFGSDSAALFCVDAPKLTTLYLQDVMCHKDKVRIKLFRSALPQLKILDLESTPYFMIDEIGLVFENCVSLEELYLGNNEQVTNETLHSLCSGQLPMLHTLCVVNTNVTEDMERFVRSKLKNLKDFKCSKQESACNHFLMHECPI